MFNCSEEDVKKFVFERVCDDILEDFEVLWSKYKEIPHFKLQDNIYDKYNNYNDELHLIIRYATQYFITKSFEAMKVDLTDSNVCEDLSLGNIGTPGRLSKMWLGSSIKDSSELLCGRWSKKPRIAVFPNLENKKLPITKRVSLNSCCSHHIAPFSTKLNNEAYAIISYIPEEYVLGISKLQRLVDWVSKRGWLQEDLTKKLHDEVAQVAQTGSVYVKLYNIIHTCELLRGVENDEGSFTSVYFSGLFENEEYRRMIK